MRKNILLFATLFISLCVFSQDRINLSTFGGTENPFDNTLRFSVERAEVNRLGKSASKNMSTNKLQNGIHSVIILKASKATKRPGDFGTVVINDEKIESFYFNKENLIPYISNPEDSVLDFNSINFAEYGFFFFEKYNDSYLVIWVYPEYAKNMLSKI